MSIFQLVLAGLLLALVIVLILYGRFRRNRGHGNSAAALRYFALVFASGLLAYAVCKYVGIVAACTLPENPGNLCGLTGYFVTGPLGAIVAMVGMAWYLGRPERRASGDQSEE